MFWIQSASLFESLNVRMFAQTAAFYPRYREAVERSKFIAADSPARSIWISSDRGTRIAV
jgi:hypothetical protein